MQAWSTLIIFLKFFVLGSCRCSAACSLWSSKAIRDLCSQSLISAAQTEKIVWNPSCFPSGPCYNQNDPLIRNSVLKPEKGLERGYIYFLVRIFKLNMRFMRAPEGAWLPGRAEQLFNGERTPLQHMPGSDHHCHTFRLHSSALNWQEKDDFGSLFFFFFLLPDGANIFSVFYLISDLLW